MRQKTPGNGPFRFDPPVTILENQKQGGKKMCGRFAATISREMMERLYQIDLAGEVVPRYNIAPSQYALVLRLNPATAERELVALKWGLIPGWFRSEFAGLGSGFINARAESVSTKPAFKSAFKHRRALVPASGFYEWQKTPAAKQPYLIQVNGGRPFSFAGLWERWDRGDLVLESFTIIPAEAGQNLAAIHQRMPVIIPREGYRRWLDPASSETELTGMLKCCFPENQLTLYPVSNMVNNPGNDLPACILPRSPGKR